MTKRTSKSLRKTNKAMFEVNGLVNYLQCRCQDMQDDKMEMSLFEYLEYCDISCYYHHMQLQHVCKVSFCSIFLGIFHHWLKGNGTLIVGVGGFIYVYKRLGLQYSLIFGFICCLGCFGVFVHVSFIYMICKH